MLVIRSFVIRLVGWIIGAKVLYAPSFEGMLI
jgi:hypothetical protein